MLSIIESLSKVFDNITIEIDDYEFVYFINTANIWTEAGGNVFGNLTPDYATFVHSGLQSMTYANPKNKFECDRNSIIEIIIKYIGRVNEKLMKHNAEQADWFSRMLDKPAESFREAMQRILFVNMIIWQTNHRLIGLGHWDVILGDYYLNDINVGILDRNGALDCICGVLKQLHNNYKFKSNLLLGDTGQIIILGGSSTSGEYICNELTEIIIEAVALVKQSDPKALLRVNQNTPRLIIELAIKCIASGCGSPLISNDDAIIPRLVDFGIPTADAVNYTTSACWEPLIGGKDSSLNNVTTLNFMRGLNNVFQRDILGKIKTFEQFKERYFLYLSRNINAVKRVVSLQRFQYDPVLSLFMIGCYENSCDVSHGGAVYHDIGITSVALANTVNALLNIKELVFDKSEYTLEFVKQMIISDFNGFETLPLRLKSRENAYGVDDDEIISLTNEIIRFVTASTIDFRNYLGGRLKFGLSAPSYIDSATGFPASFDGRLENEPFVVHISNEKVSSFTTIMNFAAALDYKDNRFNGNVVDLMATPKFITENAEKIIDLILTSIKVGFFQMQMNVVSSETLIAAKKSPADFPNLIVRVWGFSAYMIDLPEEYKDVLIVRAIENERV